MWWLQHASWDILARTRAPWMLVAHKKIHEARDARRRLVVVRVRRRFMGDGSGGTDTESALRARATQRARATRAVRCCNHLKRGLPAKKVEVLPRDQNDGLLLPDNTEKKAQSREERAKEAAAHASARPRGRPRSGARSRSPATGANP